MGIFLVVKNEFIKSLKNKKKLILGLIIPVLAVLVGIGANSIMKPSINIGIINNKNTTISGDFKEKAEDIQGVTISVAKEELINTDMILGKYACILKFIEEDLIEVSAIDNNLKQQFEAIVNNYITGGELSGINEMLIRMESESISVATRSAGFVLLTFMITATIAACNILKDKKEGALMRCSLSPIKPWVYLFGNYIHNLLSGIVQILISALILSVLPINLGISILEFCAVGIIIAFIASSFAFFVVSISDSELKASSIASSFAMIIALVGGTFLPLEKMPDAIKFLSNGSIAKWIMEFTNSLEHGVVKVSGMLPIIIISSISIGLLLISLKVGQTKLIKQQF